MSRHVPFDPHHCHLPQGGGLETVHQPQQPLPRPLDVVAVISNPCRYRSRYALYRSFEHQVAAAGARLTTVELAYGERPFEVTTVESDRHIQVRTGHELWHKENLINIGISRLPRDWTYVAWIDADVSFARPDWVQETLHQLQHYSVVQMFSHAQDLGPNHEPVKLNNGFMYSYQEGMRSDARYESWHPGFAWAARRDAINDLGGLIDWAVLGSGDRHMATALIGKALQNIHEDLHPNYRRALEAWQDRAERYIQHNVGHVPGLLYHYFHGAKRNRGYRNRWQILIQRQFDPVVDLKHDWQGVWQLTDRSIGLRDDLRRYFLSRDEDSREI